MKQFISLIKSLFPSIVVLGLLPFLSINYVFGEDLEFEQTYAFLDQGKTWTLTNCDERSDFWLCPDGESESVITIPGIFEEKVITTDVVVTLCVGTFGSGNNPTSSTFAIYSESTCTNAVTAAQSGTLPTSSSYTYVVYTVALANTNSLTNDLAIKITKNDGDKQIRLDHITVEFSFAATPATITLNEAGAISAVGGTNYVGTSYTLPESTGATCGEKTFVGWSSMAVDDTDTPPSSNYFPMGGTTLLHSTNTFYALFAQSGTATSATSIFNSLKWDVSEGPRWISDGNGAGIDTKGLQVTTGASGANATTESVFVGVTSVEVTYATNSSSGAGSIEITVGDVSMTGDAEVTKTGGTTARTITYSPALPATTLNGKVKITVNCTTNSIYVASVKINYTSYSAYSTNCGTIYDIVLHDNNGGSNNGYAEVRSDATNLINISAPALRTGYEIEGYYTTSECTTKIATPEGALQASVTVTPNTWTDGSSQWKRGDDETFYTNWEAKEYSITLDDEDATTPGSTSVTLTYNSTSHAAITNPRRNGFDFGGWYTSAGGTGTLVINTSGELQANVSNYTGAGGIWTRDEAECTLYALWNPKSYSDYVFSCATLTLEAHPETEDAPIFITSVANKKVRSQGYITITGNGLTPSTALTFPGLNNKFEVLTSTGGTISTDDNGAIDVNAYIFYTPGADETTDGLLKITGITASVGGAKPKKATLSQDIIGRHLPTAGYVIAAKKDNKWYALPSNMNSTSHPAPVEIAVDNFDNPSVAYANANTKYGLVGPTSGNSSNISNGDGQYVKLTMHPLSDAPLFGQAPSNTAIGKSGDAIATNNLSAGWWWLFTQTNTSITNPQDAKYIVHCANNTSSLSIKDNAGDPEWGLYASGVEELRLIPASNIAYTEAEVVEWGQHGAILEVDATALTGIDATSVIAHLNGANSSAITLSETKTAVKNGNTKYNYTVNFGEGIDFAAETSNGAMLTLEWKKGEAVKAMSNIVVPKIVASNITINKANYPLKSDWNTEVHVLPGKTVTVDPSAYDGSNVTIKELNIYPGATVIVSGGTLIATNLIMRNGWTRAGEKAYDVARLFIQAPDDKAEPAIAGANLTHTNAYSDWYIDYDQYYPIAVPFPVATSGITYTNTKSTAAAGVIIRYYDGARRAEHEQQDQADNWVAYTWGGTMPANLEPSKGYAMTAKRPSGKAFSIVRMPMTFTNAWTALGEHGAIGEGAENIKNQVSVTGWGKGTAEWYAMGWNFIGNPYMCTFNGDDNGISGKLLDQQGKGIRYATIPDIDFKNYTQVPIAEANLKPASAFFIQAENAEAQDITFASGNIVPPSAPMRYTTSVEDIPEQEVYIRLSYEGGKDQMGLIIGEDYTAAYEPNADLAKILGEGNAVKTYLHYGNMDMAYVAINKLLAKEWIPVTVHIPAENTYTFSLTNASTVQELEGIYLIDYANENKVTNLLEYNYTFTAEAGTITDRFALNAIVGQRPIPTGVDAVDGDSDGTQPVKFIYRDNVYILHNGTIYDATGKKVREIDK